MRIAKFISNAGICSRRNAEKLILEGKVIINNKICDKPNINVKLNDKILVNNKIISINKSIRVWKMYKPIKTICSNNDPQKRKTIFDILPYDFSRVVSIGRLDFMSEGLILLTNNGDFSRKMEHPKSKINRIYDVCIKGKISDQITSKINNGLNYKGIRYKANVKIKKVNTKNTWLTFQLKEGKNREIRNICKLFKLTILKLIRVQYGEFKLNGMKPSEVKQVKI